MPYTYIGVNNGNGWKNLPSRETPRNAANFNVMENGIKGAYQGLNELDSKIDLEVDAINQDISAINQDISAVNARVDTLESMTDLAVIDTQSGSFVQSTIADDCVAEVTIEGKTVVTPADPLQDISPDNPATITSVGDEPFDVLATGKNLFDATKAPQTGDSWGYLVADKGIGYVKLRYTNPEARLSYRAYYTKSLFKIGKTYTVSCTAKGSGENQIALRIGYINKSTGQYVGSSNTVTVSDQYDYFLVFWINDSSSLLTGTYTAEFFNIQLEENTVATPYEPYKGNKITISHPLRSIPNTDVKDTLEISSNGKGKYTQRIIRVTGQETFEFRNNGNGTDTVSFNIKNLGVKQGYNNVLCTHFKADNSSTNGVEGIAAGQSGELYIEILKSRLEGYSDSLTNAQRAALFKNWWTSNNVQAYAELTTPIVIEFDLTTLVLYKGITNILTTASIQPNITAKFYSRLNNAVDVLRGMPATNLITNGDFRYGTAGWYTVGATGFTALNNEATFTITSQYGRIYSSVPLTGSRKIYFAGLIKTLSNDVRLVVGTDAIVNATGKAYGRSGDYERLSLVYTSPTTMTNFYYGIADYSNSNWKPINVKYLIALDLTEIFGAGNEPSKEDMDLILSKYPNGWFNGTVNPLLTHKEMFNYFNNKYRALASAIIALGGTV